MKDYIFFENSVIRLLSTFDPQSYFNNNDGNIDWKEIGFKFHKKRRSYRFRFYFPFKNKFSFIKLNNNNF